LLLLSWRSAPGERTRNAKRDDARAASRRGSVVPESPRPGSLVVLPERHWTSLSYRVALGRAAH
jgi:hypothetical protein